MVHLELLKGFDYAAIILNIKKIERAVNDSVLKRKPEDVIHLADELVYQARLLRAWLQQEAGDELSSLRGNNGSEG